MEPAEELVLGFKLPTSLPRSAKTPAAVDGDEVVDSGAAVVADTTAAVTGPAATEVGLADVVEGARVLVCGIPVFVVDTPSVPT